MSRAPIELLGRVAIAAAAASLAACAAHDRTPPAVASPASPPNAAVLAAARAPDSLRGRSRDEIAASLGTAEVVRFDSGYEVWVYRLASSTAAGPAELVLLFTPAHSVGKVRVRSPTAR